MSKLYRPTECANVNCVAMCSLADYDFRKGFFGNNPTKCPNYKKGASNTIAELEKIKANFEELANDEWNIQVGASKGLECAIDVIEDRISELKGESNAK